jgi:hypothetical protein
MKFTNKMRYLVFLTISASVTLAMIRSLFLFLSFFFNSFAFAVSAVKWFVTHTCVILCCKTSHFCLCIVTLGDFNVNMGVLHVLHQWYLLFLCCTYFDVWPCIEYFCIFRSYILSLNCHFSFSILSISIINLVSVWALCVRVSHYL